MFLLGKRGSCGFISKSSLVNGAGELLPAGDPAAPVPVLDVSLGQMPLGLREELLL